MEDMANVTQGDAETGDVEGDSHRASLGTVGESLGDAVANVLWAAERTCETSPSQQAATIVFVEDMLMRIKRFGELVDAADADGPYGDVPQLMDYLDAVFYPANAGVLPDAAREAVKALKIKAYDDAGSTSKADSDEYHKRVGERMAKARELRGLSIVDAAGMLHVSSQALYKYEKGDRTIKAKLVYDAARVYRVEGEWLLCLKDHLKVTSLEKGGVMVERTYFNL